MNPAPLSFTLKFNGIARELKTKVLVSIAFDPANTLHFPQPQEFTALWDTGATDSVISERVATQCGLKPIGMAIVNTANGKRDCNVYLINIALPNRVGFPHVKVTEGILAGDIDVLIGMDIISSGDFVLTNKNGKTVFSFRHPSTECIDFVADGRSSSPNLRPEPKIGRNAPCPCGSGKKYKYCCANK